MRGDGRIYERGGKLWIAYYAPGPKGKRVQIRESSGSSNRKVAKDLLKKRVLQRDMARARGMRFIGPEAERVTVGRILDSLESDYKARRIKSLRPVLQHIKRVRAHFGFWRALSVTAESARNYIAQRRADGRADATIDRELEQLRAAFRLAKDEQILGEIPKIAGLGSRARNRRQVFFTLAEASDFFAAAAELDPDGFDYYRHLFLSGLRPSALRSFTWQDFNEDAFTLRIPSDKDKNREARTLAIDGDLRDIFESRMKRRYPGCEWIHHRAGRQLKQAWVAEFFYAACKAAKIPSGRKVAGGKTPYDLKRTALGAMLDSGMPIRRGMIQSGHTTEGTFLDYGMSEDVGRQRQDLRQRDAFLKANMPAPGSRQENLFPLEKKA